MFITFEGGEGCGKSTHSRLLKEYLIGRGLKAVLTREPGGTVLGKELRHALLKGKRLFSRYTELFLFAADRAEHVESVIKPALKAGKILISDRFIDSTTAYQVGGRRIPEALVAKINATSSSGLIPDLTFLLDITPEVGIARGTKRTKKDKFESEDIAFHKRVRAAYLRIAKRDPRRVKVISSTAGQKEVQDLIRKAMDEKLGD